MTVNNRDVLMVPQSYYPVATEQVITLGRLNSVVITFCNAIQDGSCQ
ncbi:hypothetical protein [Citrobacter cronae]|nr:hypothetical protein [Citrobacter cronae]MCU6176464.1 hypothetical protein [Citrobacter cronae]